MRLSHLVSAGLVGLAQATLPISLFPNFNAHPPAVCDLAKSWDRDVVFSGHLGLNVDTKVDASLGLCLNDAHIEGSITLGACPGFQAEPTLRMSLAGFKASFALGISASASLQQTVQLIASPEMVIDTDILDVDLGAAFALDLVVDVGAAIDLNAGFYLSFAEGDYLDVSIHSKKIVGSCLDGLVIKALDVAVGAEVDLSAEIAVKLGLRLRSHAYLHAGLDLLGLDLDAGAEVAIWTDLCAYTLTLIQTHDCAVSIGSEFALNAGVAVNLGVKALNLLDISFAPALNLRLGGAAKVSLCLPSRGHCDVPGLPGGSVSSASIPHGTASASVSRATTLTTLSTRPATLSASATASLPGGNGNSVIPSVSITGGNSPNTRSSIPAVSATGSVPTSDCNDDDKSSPSTTSHNGSSTHIDTSVTSASASVSGSNGSKSNSIVGSASTTDRNSPGTGLSAPAASATSSVPGAGDCDNDDNSSASTTIRNASSTRTNPPSTSASTSVPAGNGPHSNSDVAFPSTTGGNGASTPANTVSFSSSVSLPTGHGSHSSSDTASVPTSGRNSPDTPSASVSASASTSVVNGASSSSDCASITGHSSSSMSSSIHAVSSTTSIPGGNNGEDDCNDHDVPCVSTASTSIPGNNGFISNSLVASTSTAGDSSPNTSSGFVSVSVTATPPASVPGGNGVHSEASSASTGSNDHTTSAASVSASISVPGGNGPNSDASVPASTASGNSPVTASTTASVSATPSTPGQNDSQSTSVPSGPNGGSSASSVTTIGTPSPSSSVVTSTTGKNSISEGQSASQITITIPTGTEATQTPISFATIPGTKQSTPVSIPGNGQQSASTSASHASSSTGTPGYSHGSSSDLVTASSTTRGGSSGGSTSYGPSFITISGPDSVPTHGSHSDALHSSITGGSKLTTSTVTNTRVYTITSCAAEVSNCPASQRTIITTTVVESYVTVCPVTATGAAAVPTSSVKSTMPAAPGPVVGNTSVEHVSTTAVAVPTSAASKSSVNGSILSSYVSNDVTSTITTTATLTTTIRLEYGTSSVAPTGGQGNSSAPKSTMTSIYNVRPSSSTPGAVSTTALNSPSQHTAAGSSTAKVGLTLVLPMVLALIL